jgi:HEAT repeat protein
VSASAELLARIGAPERAVQRRACDEALERVGSDAALRDALRELLRGPSPLARFGAAWVLFQSERPTLRLLPALLDALELADGDLRWQAAQMLAALGRLQPEVISVLWHEAANATAPARRRMAVFTLRELAPERPETAAVFLQALADPDGDVRRAALACFAKLGEPSRALVERTLALAHGADPDPRMARIAAVVLPELAKHHPDLAPAIGRALEQLEGAPDPSLARAAQAARARLANTDE